MVHGMCASILGAFRDLLSFLFSLWAVLLGCLYVDRYQFDVFKIISIFYKHQEMYISLCI